MAIDSAGKRYSALRLGCVWRGPATFPDGTIGADGRLSLAWLYGGLAADAPVTVPDVVGQDQASAEAEIAGEGLLFAIATAYSETVPVGDVISQIPAAGSSVAAGSTVTITVSLGPQAVQGGGRFREEPQRLDPERMRMIEEDDALLAVCITVCAALGQVEA